MDPNVILQYFQMYIQQQQNPGMMGMNPGMMGMNPGMMGMNSGMMGMNSGMMGMNPGMMGMNPGMMGMNPGMMGMNSGMINLNNLDINNMKNIFRSMGYNEEMINNFFSMFAPQQPQKPNNNSSLINLYFKHKTTQNKIIIQTTFNESLASVVNKYITKSGDNHVNLYLNNGKKLNETLSVGEAGLIDYSIIDVVAIEELEGGLFI